MYKKAIGEIMRITFQPQLALRKTQNSNNKQSNPTSLASKPDSVSFGRIDSSFGEEAIRAVSHAKFITYTDTLSSYESGALSIYADRRHYILEKVMRKTIKSPVKTSYSIKSSLDINKKQFFDKTQFNSYEKRIREALVSSVLKIHGRSQKNVYALLRDVEIGCKKGEFPFEKVGIYNDNKDSGAKFFMDLGGNKKLILIQKKVGLKPNSEIILVSGDLEHSLVIRETHDEFKFDKLIKHCEAMQAKAA